MTAAVIGFWFSVAVFLYGYIGFPLLLGAVARVRGREVRVAPVTPSISLIIIAYNEEKEIGHRLKNALAMNYPRNLLEVIVASDGSTDGTAREVSRFDTDRVHFLRLPRRGKAHALNDAASYARGEILVFSDANTLIEPDAMKALARNFFDLEVGGVAGHTGYVVRAETEPAGRGEHLYWRYDTWLKTMESRTGSVVSAHGGIYAIRKSLFRPLEDAAVTDDFAVSTSVVEQGYRLVFESEARGYEAVARKSGQEFRRRVRLMTRGLRGVLLRRRLLNPFRYGFYSVSLFSHKVLRRLLPLLLPVLLLSSVVIRSASPFYAAILGAQLLFYGLAAAGWMLNARPAGRLKLLYVPFFFCMANLASVIAIRNLLLGRRIERWDPPRHDSDEARSGTSGAGRLEAG